MTRTDTVSGEYAEFAARAATILNQASRHGCTIIVSTRTDGAHQVDIEGNGTPIGITRSFPRSRRTLSDTMALVAPQGWRQRLGTRIATVKAVTAQYYPE